MKKIKKVLISVFNKDGLLPLLSIMKKNDIEIVTTGGTYNFIIKNGFEAKKVEDITAYPSILGGRVKTLHPKIFGGILGRSELEKDKAEMQEFDIFPIDLVIVDLYPFEDTVKSAAKHQDIIEKIDIGGISLIRAAAKNYQDVLVIADKSQFSALENILQMGSSTLDERRKYATASFAVSSHYDTKIYEYMYEDDFPNQLRISKNSSYPLRYGENPHQQAIYFGIIEDSFEKLNGKDLSFNNLVDIDAAVQLIQDFEEPYVFCILKHTNPCGVGIGTSVENAYKKAFEADTISAFGGVLITNNEVTLDAAKVMNDLFFEVLIAPSFDLNALDLLSKKKNRILLKQKKKIGFSIHFKSLLGGVVFQNSDQKVVNKKDLKCVTKKQISEEEIQAVLFANKIVKHTKSNAIVLAINGQLLAHGVGQTSRVDALRQAIQKAKVFGFNLKGAVMASDAFFPFPDCIEIAEKQGISAVIQPGGSIRDADSIQICNEKNIAMVLTGYRHFKH